MTSLYSDQTKRHDVRRSFGAFFSSSWLVRHLEVWWHLPFICGRNTLNGWIHTTAHLANAVSVHQARFTEGKMKWKGDMSLWVYIGFLVLLMGQFSIVNTQCAPPTCYVDEDGQETLCIKCLVGWGVTVTSDKDILECQQEPFPRNTNCSQCISGMNYSDVHDAENVCRSCTVCHPDKEEENRTCTAEQNRVCQCKTGVYYQDPELAACKECTKCEADEDVIQECLQDQNRQCGPKRTTTPEPTTTPESTTSATTTGTSPTPGEPVEKPRTANPSTQDEGKDDLIIVAIAVPVAIVLFIIGLFLCLYKEERRRQFRMCIGCGQAVEIGTDGISRQDSNMQPLCNCCFSIGPETKINADHMTYTNIHNGTGEVTTNGKVHTQNGHAGGGGAPRQNGTHNGGVRGPAELGSTGEGEEGERQQAERQGLIPGSVAEPTAPPQDPLFTQTEEEHILDYLECKEAVTMAGQYLNVPAGDLAEWRSQGSAVSYLMERWEDEERTKEEFIAGLRAIGKDRVANFLANAVA